MIEKAKGARPAREDILALYGVQEAKDEKCRPTREEVIDLTDKIPEQTSSTQNNTQGKTILDFDCHRGKVARAWADGRVE